MIGERLSELRQDKNTSQQELADKLSLSVHTISSYERNISNPDDEMKKRISELFDVSVDYLIGTTDNQIIVNKSKSSVIILKNFSDKAINEIEVFIKSVEKNIRNNCPYINHNI